jgi:uncharacterized protein YkwD
VKRCLFPFLALVSVLLMVAPAPAGATRHHRSTKVAHPGGHARWGAPKAHTAGWRSCPGANLTPNAHNLRRVKAATLCLINRERARHGERPLKPNRRLMRAAHAHSEEMVARDYFGHVSPNGTTPLDRIRASGFIAKRSSWSIGENIAWGTLWLATPRAIVQAWMQSPGHRANILDRAYRYSGIGIDPALPHSMSDGQDGAMYTQDFGALTR